MKNEPGHTMLAEHRIETENARPIRQMPYRLPYVYRDEVLKDLKEMQESGIIEPSTSEWSSPIVLVKDGTLRMCVDFRPFILQTDAYDRGVGAVLSQCDDEGLDHLVAYFNVCSQVLPLCACSISNLWYAVSAEPGRKAPYSIDLHHCMIWQIIGTSLPYRKVAQNLNVAVGTVHNVLCRFQATGELEPTKPDRSNTRKLSNNQELLLVGLFLDNPGLYLGEVCREVADIIYWHTNFSLY